MSAVMASESSSVFALLGHGCVYMDRPPIRVPKGVIWIEMATCGQITYLGLITRFHLPQIQAFLESTPMPTNQTERDEYNRFLYRNLNETVEAKFANEMVAAGNNNLFGKAVDKDKNVVYFKSGIYKLYDPAMNHFKNQRRTILPSDYEKLYVGSMYPTVEQIRDKPPTMENYRIEYEDLFHQIEAQAYEVTKPMIIIQAGCRNACMVGPELRRQNSAERQNLKIARLPKETLLERKPDGRTLLMVLVQSKLYDQAKHLVDKLETELTPIELIEFVAAQDSSRKTAQGMLPETAVDMYAYLEEKIATARRKHVAKQDEELDRIDETVDVDFLFDALLTEKRRTVYETIVERLVALSSIKPDEILNRRDLFTLLDNILLSRYGDHEIETLLRNISSSAERKALLKAKFKSYDAESVKPTHRIRNILSDIGVMYIWEGGRRTMKRKIRGKRSTC